MEVKQFEMPDGSKVSVPEEKWELINELTVSDNCSMVVINKDSQNQSFNLKKVMVRAKFVSSGNTAANYVADVRFDDGGNNGVIHFGSVPKDTETAGLAHISAEINNGVFMITEQRSSANKTSVYKNMVYQNQYNRTDYFLNDDLTIGPKKIDMVQINTIAQTIAQGSVIKVWGVRA